MQPMLIGISDNTPILRNAAERTLILHWKTKNGDAPYKISHEAIYNAKERQDFFRMKIEAANG